jgi:hypothetical protein
MKHPASRKASIPFHKFLWRYFSGHHLDGIPRTDASWLKPGTTPAHHVNWWSAKPRAHRMVWRWAFIIIPIGWFLAYRISLTVSVNLVIFFTVTFVPYLIHHGVCSILRLIPKPHVVVVREQIYVSDIDHKLDDIFVDVDSLQELLDLDMTNEMENSISESPVPKKRRS